MYYSVSVKKEERIRISEFTLSQHDDNQLDHSSERCVSRKRPDNKPYIHSQTLKIASCLGSELSLKWQNRPPTTMGGSFCLAMMGICTFSLVMEVEQETHLESLATPRTSRWCLSFQGRT